MRIALISDVHANLTALEVVLADVERVRVDQTVFLGDAIYFGPQPKACLKRIAELDCLCVMGNADAVCIQYDDLRRGNAPMPKINPETRWTADQLDPVDFDFLRRFQATIEVKLGDGHTLLCFHGSPNSNTERIEATIHDDDLSAKLGGHRASVMAGGHTHLSMMRQHRGMLMVNPGSVGMAFERPRSEERDFLLPWAEYGIVTLQGGVLSVDLRRVPYHVEAVKQAARESQKPGFEHWLNDWVEIES
ncbi:MAG: metallophosphoesterase family protein [Chloroflexi bacterium]|nr:metallophosphoesterase family protein [Chloroflexota bacterium]